MEQLTQIAWDTDAVIAINELKARNQIRNHDYFMDTVDAVEELVSPIRQGMGLTLEDLEEWVARCKQEPITEVNDHASKHPQRVIRPSY